MACISKRKTKNGKYYYVLVEGKRVNGKVEITQTHLGTKPPWPETRGWKNLSPDRITWLKERVTQKTSPIKIPKGQVGKYSTIVIDPPWPMERIGREMVVGEEMSFDYPTMTIAQIKNDRKLVPVRKLTNKNGCFVFLWTTQKHLPQAYQILDAWDFKYLFTMVWQKGHGMKPFNLPLFNCEFVVVGKKGDITFLNTRDFKTSFPGERRNHSQKPKEFYALLRRVTPEPRIDIFSREKHRGFDQYGNETTKFS